MIRIEPFKIEYAAGCAELLRFLWKGDKKEREERFKWAYLQNPFSDEVLSVIAITENNEVVGFRGYFISEFKKENKNFLIAFIADTVVHEKIRRQGIFERMNIFSFDFLHQHGINIILNLTPSWPPYYGYKKLGFKDLSDFKSKYAFYPINHIKINHKKTNIKNIYIEKKQKNIVYTLSNQLPLKIARQIKNLSKESNLFEANLSETNLIWRSQRPSANYLYAYATNGDNMIAFYWFKKINNIYHIGLCSFSSLKSSIHLYKFFVSEMQPSGVAVWTFALSESQKTLFKKLHFISIPGLNKVRKNPPCIVRSLLTDKEGNIIWNVENMDISKIENWHINKFDCDTF